ncbi:MULTISPECIES: transporter substrate-binding domain-containing protein [unclassified Caballeronia]|uniref:transporter substrate-binding domain-containing protein n=1 Tax=unclassified Caballeronia TaxID=2646786 RepID=UPI00285F8BB6|nr:MULTISPECIES: transporter substrate-binding domain-containing protein [unclassified Caballeronia]MDR5752083.1 transporter substrate-binding domain-containing protein [Caballeronia sp. LZ024]MDR5843776.1 transporter substrate-binding domain-containing protein [Caballeronia sp. LZ031]
MKNFLVHLVAAAAVSFTGSALAQTVQAGTVSGRPAASATPAVAAPAPSRLDDVLARHTLRVCTTGDYKPYSFLKPDGQFEGIDIDLAESLAKSLGVKAEYVKTSWSNLMNDFVAKCDIAVGGVSTTLERQKRAFFTEPYMVDGKTPIVRCDDVEKYQTVEQIDQPAVRTIVNPGGTNERFAKQFFTHSQLIEYPDNVTIFKQILDGHADVMVTDASETLLQQKLNPGLCSVHPDKPFQFGEKAYLVPRGDVPFQQYVDQWLHLARSTGEFQSVVDKWLK